MYQKTVLSNGIRVITEEIPHVHSVSSGIWLTSGSRDEKKEENGVSHFVEHMLFKGTGKRDAREIARTIDSVGGLLNGYTSRECINFYAKVLKNDFPLAIELLSDIFLNSTFSPEEMEKERGVILQEIHAEEDTPDEYIQDLFSQSFFKEHPLGRPILGSYQFIEKIKRDDLVSFFRKNCLQPSRIIVSVAGNLKHGDVVKRTEDAFGILSEKESSLRLNSPQACSHISVYSKDLEQVHICIGTRGLSQTHPLRYAGYFLNNILGGGMSSRLFQEIREKEGLVYSIYSYLASYSDTGLLIIYAGTGKQEATRVIDLATKEMRKLKENPVGSSELARVKQQLKGNLLLAWESTDSRMQRLARNEICFEKFISIEEIIENIEKVTASQIQELAREIFSKDYLSLAVLGPLERSNLPETIFDL